MFAEILTLFTLSLLIIIPIGFLDAVKRKDESRVAYERYCQARYGLKLDPAEIWLSDFSSNGKELAQTCAKAFAPNLIKEKPVTWPSRRISRPPQCPLRKRNQPNASKRFRGPWL